MSSNPLKELQNYGQSFWHDNIQRSLITSGELRRLIEEDGLRGVTSNPIIFEKAIMESSDYDEEIRALKERGCSVSEVYESLAVRDIQMAADVLLPVYEATEGKDGFVSLEVSPHLAFDTAGTIEEARRLRGLVNRPNLMVKVPATPEGIPAIEQLLAEGLNINITLLFALDNYEQVARAYLNALERRERDRKPLKTVASVASFFVSRVDTMADRELQGRIQASSEPQEQQSLKSLSGKAAIANAKIAYHRFKVLFGGDRFRAFQEKGARVQRLLWASTSTKNPEYRDVMYVEELIGPETVNTMPPATLNAFRDHGLLRPSLEENVEDAFKALRRLEEIDIDMDRITRQLQQDGVKLFADAFDKLLAGIERKQEMVVV